MSKPKTNVAQQPTPSGLVRGLKWIAGPAALLAVLGWMVGFVRLARDGECETRGDEDGVDGFHGFSFAARGLVSMNSPGSGAVICGFNGICKASSSLPRATSAW